MSFGHGWDWQPPQTASLIHFRQIQSVWAHWYAVHGHRVVALHSYTHPLGSNLGALSHLWSQNVVSTSWLRLKATSNCFPYPYYMYTQYLTTLICCQWAYSSSLTQSYPHFLAFGGFWVTCGVKMISLNHGWGWPPPQTAFLIHIRLIQSVWAHWYAVYGHTVAALHSHAHTTWLRFLGSGSLMWIKNDVIMSWLRLLSYSNCLTHPY